MFAVVILPSSPPINLPVLAAVRAVKAAVLVTPNLPLPSRALIGLSRAMGVDRHLIGLCRFFADGSARSFLDGMFVPEGTWLAPCLYGMVAGVRTLAKQVIRKSICKFVGFLPRSGLTHHLYIYV